MQIWDTAGQQRFRTIVNTYYKSNHLDIQIHMPSFLFSISPVEIHSRILKATGLMKSKAIQTVMLFWSLLETELMPMTEKLVNKNLSHLYSRKSWYILKLQLNLDKMLEKCLLEQQLNQHNELLEVLEQITVRIEEELLWKKWFMNSHLQTGRNVLAERLRTDDDLL